MLPDPLGQAGWAVCPGHLSIRHCFQYSMPEETIFQNSSLVERINEINCLELRLAVSEILQLSSFNSISKKGEVWLPEGNVFCCLGVESWEGQNWVSREQQRSFSTPYVPFNRAEVISKMLQLPYGAAVHIDRCYSLLKYIFTISAMLVNSKIFKILFFFCSQGCKVCLKSMQTRAHPGKSVLLTIHSTVETSRKPKLVVPEGIWESFRG